MQEVVEMCEYVAIMSRGRMVAIGTVDELLDSYEFETLEDVFLHIARAGEEHADSDADRDLTLQESA
jgi:ABC-type multidrug transport system ATPase subunit